MMQERFLRFLWAVPLAFGVIGLLASLQMRAPAPTAVAVSASASFSMLFLLSGLSMSAALQAGRFYEWSTTASPTARGGRLARSILGSLVLWAVGFWIVYWARYSFAVGLWALPYLPTLGLSLVAAIAWMVFGVASVHLAGRIGGVVLALVCPFAFSSGAWALNNVALRHLFGLPLLCCSMDATLSSAMVKASAMFLLGLGGISIALMLALPPGRRPSVIVVPRVVVAVISIGLLVSAYPIAQSVDNYVAAEPRDRSQLICAEKICYWPETDPTHIAANSQVINLLHASMPPEWLNQVTTIAPSTFVRIGPIDGSSLWAGEYGAPVSFVYSAEEAEIYLNAARQLTIRAGFEEASWLDKEQWWQWAHTPRAAAPTPSEIGAWIALH